MRYFASFGFDDGCGLLWRDGIRVPLTGKASAVLKCLIDADGQPVEKHHILSAVWGDTHVTPDNIKVLIREIRQALGDNVHAPRFIRTLPRNGYEFIAPVSDAPPELGREASPFVGRRIELDFVDRLYESAAGGHRGAVLLSSPSGLGKTALCERALHRASKRGFLVAQAQCVPCSGTAEPYGPLLDAMHRLLCEYPQVRELIAPHAPALLQHLDADGPGVVRIGRGATGAPPDSPRLLREIVAALEELSLDAQVVLALEDVQWLDPASIDVLGALARRRRPARLGLIATCRPLEAFDVEGLRLLFDELESSRTCTVLRLQPLSSSEVAEYVSLRFDMVVAGTLARRLYSASGGHPLLLTAAAEAIVERGVARRSGNRWLLAGATELATTVIDTLAGIMDRHLDQVTRDVRMLLTCASRQGLRFSLARVARAARLEPPAIALALNRLANLGEIIERVPSGEPEEFRFTHVMYLEALSSAANEHRAAS